MSCEFTLPVQTPVASRSHQTLMVQMTELNWKRETQINRRNLCLQDPTQPVFLAVGNGPSPGATRAEWSGQVRAEAGSRPSCLQPEGQCPCEGGMGSGPLITAPSRRKPGSKPGHVRFPFHFGRPTSEPQKIRTLTYPAELPYKPDSVAMCVRAHYNQQSKHGISI